MDNIESKNEFAGFGKVCVLGLGKSGLAAARWCARESLHDSAAVESLCIYGGAGKPEAVQSAQDFVDAGIPVIFDSQEVEGEFDTCICSPGISNLSPFYQSACSHARRVISEPQAAFDVSPEDWVVVTGTNGKTTSTALCSYLLNQGGVPARPVGNIGDTCMDALESRASGEYFVAELSSYQLASCDTILPRAAVLLNITPDHLHWHGSHQAYIDAKMKVFANMGPENLAIVDYSTPDARACADTLRQQGLEPFIIDISAQNPPVPGAGLKDGFLHIALPGQEPCMLCRPEELRIKGGHNVINALAAASIALFCGAQLEGVICGLKSFEALEHRIEACGCIDGVSYYNDSKGTNTDATLKALDSFPGMRVHVLLGGRDKGTDLGELVDACSRSCASVVCYGESKQRFLEAFSRCSAQVKGAEGMADALSLARSYAQSGDVILLSPACASFDEFNSFEHRGEVFKELVAKAARER